LVAQLPQDAVREVVVHRRPSPARPRRMGVPPGAGTAYSGKYISLLASKPSRS
jgi:hypothetical protein